MWISLKECTNTVVEVITCFKNTTVKEKMKSLLSSLKRRFKRHARIFRNVKDRKVKEDVKDVKCKGRCFLAFPNARGNKLELHKRRSS